MCWHHLSSREDRSEGGLTLPGGEWAARRRDAIWSAKTSYAPWQVLWALIRKPLNLQLLHDTGPASGSVRGGYRSLSAARMFSTARPTWTSLTGMGSLSDGAHHDSTDFKLSPNLPNPLLSALRRLSLEQASGHLARQILQFLPNKNRLVIARDFMYLQDAADQFAPT